MQRRENRRLRYMEKQNTPKNLFETRSYVNMCIVIPNPGEMLGFVCGFKSFPWKTVATTSVERTQASGVES